MNADVSAKRLGWIGTGRMGYALAGRLLRGGCEVAVYNRTRAKAEPLAKLGATVVDSPADLADRDIVFTMVAGPEDFKAVVLGEDGLLSRPDTAPPVVVDSSTVSPDASAEVRVQTEARGVALLAAPVSGNPSVVDAGKLTVVASGPALHQGRPGQVRPPRLLSRPGGGYALGSNARERRRFAYAKGGCRFLPGQARRLCSHD